MSVQALSAAFAMEIESPTVKLVLLALANYADADYRCWPSQKTLQKLTSLSERSIRNALEVLESDGLITKTVRRRPDGSRATDIIGLAFLQSAPHAGSDQAASVAGSATGTSCRNNRQMAPEQPARRAPLTTFEPSKEPSAPSEGAGKSVWNSRLKEALASGGDGLNLTVPAMHVHRDLRLLVEPEAGEPCTWPEVLDAIRIEAAKAKTRGRPIKSWSWVRETALAMRDRRLAGLPPPGKPHERPHHDNRQSAHAQRLADIGAAMAAPVLKAAG